MEPIKDYNIVFTSVDGIETIAANWEKNEANGFTYYNTYFDKLRISVIENKENALYLRAGNAGQQRITGFIGIRFNWDVPAEGYTVIPGIYYNGNYHNIIKNIPGW